MDLVFSPIGIICLSILMMLYVFFSRRTFLGALSLPCMTILTSMVYYFLMPAMAFSGGNSGFLNVQIESLQLIHLAVLLYILGASTAFLVGHRIYSVNPEQNRYPEREINTVAVWVILAVIIGGLVSLTMLNRLNLLASSEFYEATPTSDFAFLQNSLSMLLPVCVIYCVRNDFKIKSILIILLTLLILLVSGFRYRIAILLMALAASFAIVRGFRFGIVPILMGTAVSLVVFNALGASRRYGGGIDFSVVGQNSWSEWLHAFGGEVGPIFAFYSVIEVPPSELIMFDPWVIAIARLVPSFVWPDKPFPEYLEYFTVLFDDNVRKSAGIAGPQQAEMLLQFGWFGLPFLAFFVFTLITWLMSRLAKLGREGRIAGISLASGVFGFYMQQRGYASQNLTEVIFVFSPIFFMYKSKKKAKEQQHKHM